MKIKVWVLNYGLMKLLMGTFVFYLIIEEFKLFLIKKPTQTSFSEMSLHPQLNPNIFVCMNPAYDYKGLR